MAILNLHNHFNTMKQNSPKLLQVRNFGAKSGGKLALSSTAKADLPQGIGMDPVLSFDTTLLSNLPSACLHQEDR